MTLQQSINEFLRHCQFEKNLSEKTIKAYSTDLTQFSTFLFTREFPIDINLISKVHLRAYLESLSPLKPKSVKRKIATAKALFIFLEFEDELLVNPFRKLRIRIKEEKRLPSVLSITEISKILKVAYKQKDRILSPQNYTYLEAVRNIVVLELLFTTGARVSEIAGIKTRWMDLNSGCITIKGKGNKERIIQVWNAETLSVLKCYQEIVKSKNNTSYFLINRFYNKLSDQSIRHIVNKFSRAAGINRKITPHTFRHSFATLLLEKDVDIKYIQSLLGHSSIVTTQIYTHVNRAKQKQILRTKHPRRHLNMIAT